MYKSDKIGIDTRIGGMLGELSYDIERQKEFVEAMKEEYEEAFAFAVQAMNASVDAAIERDKAIKELERLESIDKMLREAKISVDQAYDDWNDWTKRNKS
jgi:hypothetical protein